MNPAKWFLNKYLKIYRVETKFNEGFSLIELLVAIIISFLILTPLLTFMVNIMDNDRKEQVKVTTDQDLSATLDYIKRDLQQAVYIYDADGINSIKSYLPTPSTNSFPVLVFWKRQFIPSALSIGTGAEAGTNDTYVYSLVAYYIINDDSTDTTWGPSNASSTGNVARIGRFQIKNSYGTTSASENFNLFSLSSSATSLKAEMDAWTSNDKSGTYTDASVIPLVDYIDATPINTITNPAPTCPTVNVNVTVNGVTTPTPTLMQMLPDFTTGSTRTNAIPSSSISNGFYVCVDSTNTVAEIHLRGNAFARLGENALPYNVTSTNTLTYFPQKSTRVQGIGYLYLSD